MAGFFKLLDQSSLHLPDINLLYVNALYADDLGYNKMTGIKEQADAFDRVLYAVEKRFSPVLTAIACNTLSAIYPHTAYSQMNNFPVYLISKTGTRILDEYHKQNSGIPVYVPASPTTIDSGIYNHPSEKIHPISAGTLASEIENDSDGCRIDSIIHQLYAKIHSQTQPGSAISMFLGCTHYGYITRRFLSLSGESGIIIKDIINPNDSFCEEIYHSFLSESAFPATNASGKITCSVFSRTKLPVGVRKRISGYLLPESPPVANELMDYQYVKDLF
ncbi:MAG: hypothetical protein AB7T22_05970 [Calditrichaceae bacterium]